MEKYISIPAARLQETIISFFCFDGGLLLSPRSPTPSQSMDLELDLNQGFIGLLSSAPGSSSTFLRLWLATVDTVDSLYPPNGNHSAAPAPIIPSHQANNPSPTLLTRRTSDCKPVPPPQQRGPPISNFSVPSQFNNRCPGLSAYIP